MSLLLLCYLSLTLHRYRPRGIVIPARIYHVELAAEVVLLCERPES
jgi:hypothetical protein